MLELVERQSALAGARLVAVDLVDHLAHLVLRDLEAAHVQRLLQLRQLDVARSIAVNLFQLITTKKNKQTTIGYFTRPITKGSNASCSERLDYYNTRQL